jgi:hypothetical protein
MVTANALDIRRKGEVAEEVPEGGRPAAVFHE